MKKILLFITFSVITFCSYAQYNFDMTKDEETGQSMFIGRCTFDDLSDEPSFDWFTMNSNQYNPDATITEQLKKVLPNYQIVIFMGTWCDDSHQLLPKLYKTMLLSRCFTNYKMYGVDRKKISKNNEQEAYKIEKVPTIIVMKNEKELGRIVETTQTTIEADLLRIVSAQ